VAFATGYFGQPRRLGVPGEDLPWVSSRYFDAYRHFGEHVVIVGGGNSAAEAALDLWRNGARVTLVHRGEAVKATVKYWVKPDIENRITEGSIAARFSTRVTGFGDGGVAVEGPAGSELIPAVAAYVLIGYVPDMGLLQRAGIHVDPVTLVPEVDAATCESNVPGLYVAGTLLAGRDPANFFIDNSRDPGGRSARALLARRGAAATA
jgi:thioredoxin reductase (NADPH)